MQLDAVPIGYRYPEWDFRKQSYKHDYCAVAEFDHRTMAEVISAECGL